MRSIRCSLNTTTCYCCLFTYFPLHLPKIERNTIANTQIPNKIKNSCKYQTTIVEQREYHNHKYLIIYRKKNNCNYKNSQNKKKSKKTKVENKKKIFLFSVNVDFFTSFVLILLFAFFSRKFNFLQEVCYRGKQHKRNEEKKTADAITTNYWRSHKVYCYIRCAIVSFYGGEIELFLTRAMQKRVNNQTLFTSSRGGEAFNAEICNHEKN